MNLQQYIDELNSLDPQNPGDWPLYARVGAAVLLAVIVAFAGFWFVIKPEQEFLEQELLKEPSLFEEFETKQRKVAALDAYKAQLQEMEKSFGDMLRQLPGKAEVANLLNEISQTRVASSLEEELFKPQADVVKDFYAELPNQIIVVGTYHEMGNFVSGVAALPRIVTIEEVDIRPVAVDGPGNKGKKKGDQAADASSTDGNVVLRMQALAKTYRYLDDEETAAQTAKQSKPGSGAAASKPPESGAPK